MSRAAIAAPVLVLLVISGVAKPSERSVEERIAAYAQPLVESGFLSGCLYAARGDEVFARACYGYSDAARTTRNDSNTHFCIASLTKPITMVAVMCLVDQGKLRLDDRVSTWIADFPAADSISVADLLTHAAGIPHRVTTSDEEIQRFTPADIVERVKQRGLLFPPHTRSKYSSAGYTVIAYIIERVTGMNYGDAMEALVFAPLGMKDTFHPDGRPIPHAATSFVAGPEGPVEASAKDYAFLAGAGSLYSTCDDMMRFARAYLDRELLSPAAWDAFHELGWAPDDVIHWSGSTNGFACWMDIYKEDGSVHVFLGNAGTGATNILRAALPALIAGEEPPTAPRAPARISLDVDQMEGLEGGYARSGSTPTLMVAIDHGVLKMGDNFVYPVAVDRFFNPTYFSENTFHRGEDGVATSIEVTAPGLSAPLVFSRVE